MKSIILTALILTCSCLYGQEPEDSSAVVKPVKIKKIKKRHNKTEIVTISAENAEPASDPCSQGITEARINVENSDYILFYQYDAPFTDEVAQILYEEYHIKVVIDKRKDDNFCRCHNEEMENLLNKKFNTSVIAKAVEKTKETQNIHETVDSTGINNNPF